MENGHWEFPLEFDSEDWFGFIYRITELSTGRMYLGKKQFHRHLTKAVPGKKNRKHFTKPSDWKKYTGSSVELNKAIELNGKENYKFEIMSLHQMKGSLHYAEIEILVMENALRARFDNGLRKYYNGQISAVKFYPANPTEKELKFNMSYFK